MKIQFSKKEFNHIKMLATGRHFYKDIVIPDRDMERWNNSQHEADLLGVMGEYAVSKYLKIPFDTSINLKGDGGKYDMFLGDWSIQVKATKYKNGRLVFNTLDEAKAHIHILTLCSDQKRFVKIAGFITKRDFKRKCYEQNLGHGVRYCINQDDLEEIELLPLYFMKWQNRTAA
jgi:hypothetical protein